MDEISIPTTKGEVKEREEKRREEESMARERKSSRRANLTRIMDVAKRDAGI